MHSLNHNKFLENIVSFLLNPDLSAVNELLIGIKQVIPYKMCSLWKINNESKTVSVFARQGYSPNPEKRHEYVHPIKDSLIGKILKDTENSGSSFKFIDLRREPSYAALHSSPERLEELNLSLFLSIPILNNDKDANKYKYDAVLNIYPEHLNIDDVKSDIDFIHKILSIILTKIRSNNRESIADLAIKIYEEKKKKTLSNYLHPIVNHVVMDKIPCEACSIFKWDSDSLKLTLNGTTGIDQSKKPKPKPIKELFYYKGQGITGTIAKLNKPKIIYDFDNITDPDLIGKHGDLIVEKTVNPRKSYIGVPITRPSNSNEVTGIIRLINRVNLENQNVVDYFSAEDLDLINSLKSVISFVFEIYDTERRQAAFGMQMNHEIKNPVAYIKNTSNLVLRRIPEKILYEYNSKKLLDRIHHRAESIISTSYQIRVITKKYDTSKASNYSVSNTSIKDCCHKARITIYDLLKKKSKFIDAIKIDGPIAKVHFDQYALERVFINIYTNAIKYRDNSFGKSFEVITTISELGEYPVTNRISSTTEDMEGYLVTIQDNGVGIPEGLENNIFEMGFRHDSNFSEPGSGIGLSFVSEIMNDFRSFVWVSSNAGPTEFSLFFPSFLQSKVNVLNYIQEN